MFCFVGQHVWPQKNSSMVNKADFINLKIIELIKNKINYMGYFFFIYINKQN